MTDSGISFSNNVQNTPQLNILNYLYFYNGAGTAIADFNNDALPDIMTLDMKPEVEEVLKNSVGADPYDIFEFKHDFGYHYQYPHSRFPCSVA